MLKKSIKVATSMVMLFALVCSSASIQSNISDAAIKAKKITLNKTRLSMYVGDKATIKVKKVTPKKANKAVKYKSNKKSVATVTKKGVVTAISAGNAKITITSKNNKKVKKVVKVTVSNKEESYNQNVQNNAQVNNSDVLNVMPTSTATAAVTLTATPTNEPAATPTQAPTPTVSPTPTQAPTPKPSPTARTYPAGYIYKQTYDVTRWYETGVSSNGYVHKGYKDAFDIWTVGFYDNQYDSTTGELNDGFRINLDAYKGIPLTVSGDFMYEGYDQKTILLQLSYTNPVAYPIVWKWEKDASKRANEYARGLSMEGVNGSEELKHEVWANVNATFTIPSDAVNDNRDDNTGIREGIYLYFPSKPEGSLTYRTNNVFHFKNFAIKGDTSLVAPKPTQKPTEPFDYDGYSECLWKKPGARIKALYNDYFKIGVGTEPGELRFGESASLIRYHFASITARNETKHENMITEELSKQNVDAYYSEGQVVIDFENLEKILAYCKANGLKIRYSSFVFHLNIQPYFFLQDYNYDDYQLSDYEANGWDTGNYHKLADKETMKKRLNDYISQVIEYIYSHGYGDVVYAYDVINEANNGSISYYVNENAASADEVLSTDSSKGNRFTTNPGVTTSGGNNVNSSSSPEDVMDMFSHEGHTPDASHSYWYATMGADYLYLSYLYAHDAVEKYYNQYKDRFGYKEIPSLIYNDYNTKDAEQINLVKYINLACNLEKGTSGVKYCNGIGLQSHNIRETTQENMIKNIADSGLEVQITELDEGSTGDVQASKLKKQYEIYKKYSKNGDYGKNQGADYIGVTSVTNWGVRDGDGGGWYLFEPYDDGLEEPILTYAPKPAFYAILQAGGVSAAECGTDYMGYEVPEY